MTGRPKRGFHVARMDKRITIQSETTTRDAAGQSVVTLASWLVNEPAAYESTRGGEGSRGRQVEAGIDAIFTVRYRPGYSAQQVIIYGGVKYGIVYAKEVDGHDRYRELYCKAVV